MLRALMFVSLRKTACCQSAGQSTDLSPGLRQNSVSIKSRLQRCLNEQKLLDNSFDFRSPINDAPLA
jgi:hypothetical protein